MIWKIGNIKYTPIGYGLGYCIGEHLDTKERQVYYFNGYPALAYNECGIELVDGADIKSFTSDTIMERGRTKITNISKVRL